MTTASLQFPQAQQLTLRSQPQHLTDWGDSWPGRQMSALWAGSTPRSAELGRRPLSVPALPLGPEAEASLIILSLKADVTHSLLCVQSRHPAFLSHGAQGLLSATSFPPNANSYQEDSWGRERLIYPESPNTGSVSSQV